MLDHLNGSTRVFAIVGHPIAQVKSPEKVTRAFAARGYNGVLVPLHVTPADFADFIDGIGKCQNFDGLVITVPHKFSSFDCCGTTTARSSFLKAANVMRRKPDGSWHGDMSDGLGFVAGMRGVVVDPLGKRALVVGAGGAGTAIAHAMLEAGVEHLALHDVDEERRDQLISKLRSHWPQKIAIGSPDPTGLDIVVNASPVGMLVHDNPPLQTERLSGSMFVGDVITAPAITPLLKAAQRAGCTILPGAGMYAGLLGLMVDFLLEAPSAY